MARGIFKDFERPPAWAWALIALVVVGLLAISVAVKHPVPAYTGNPPLADSTATAAPVAPSASQAIKLLTDQPSRPWTLTVLGDSTGDGPTRWVHLLATRMSADYGRPVTVHDWSNGTNSYGPQATTVGSGANAPITIWNGSATGRTAGYSQANLAAMYPAQADLVIINHGHNQSNAGQAVSEVESLIGAVDRASQTPPAVAITLQNPRLSEQPELQDQIVTAIKTRFAGTPLLEVDAYDAFKSAPSLAALLNPDGKHPNEAGSRLWADVEAEALGIQ